MDLEAVKTRMRDPDPAVLEGPVCLPGSLQEATVVDMEGMAEAPQEMSSWAAVAPRHATSFSMQLPVSNDNRPAHHQLHLQRHNEMSSWVVPLRGSLFHNSYHSNHRRIAKHLP